MTTRILSLVLAGALVAGCSSTSRLLPAAAPGGSAPQFGTTPDRSDLRVFVSVRIPRHTHRHADRRPASISPLTQSMSIAVNTVKAQIFNTTPASPGCAAGTSGTTCTFAVHAKPGTDTFTVSTYSGLNATGSVLDRGIAAKVPIAKGKANHVVVKLGPLVTNTLNTGFGSLRYAIATASSGDTIMFSLPAGSTITLAAPININGTVTIAGPGYKSLTISGGGTHQIFSVDGTATISGLTLTHGKTAAGTPGGAINNVGSLTLASDFIGSSTSTVAIRRAGRSKPPLAIVSHGFHPHCTSTTADGGGVYNNGTLIVSGTIFSGNVVQTVPGCITAQGGAIFNDQLGTLASTGDIYENNSAYAGGAVYNAAIGEASFTNDQFIGNTGCTAASGCPTSGCNATSCTSHAVGAGAAIYDHGLGITVVSSTFTNNVAGGATAGSVGEGGAIALDNSSALPTITGSTFTGNVAGGGTTSCSTGAGGAILATNPIELDNDIFKNNSATGDQTGEGGAVVASMGLTGFNDTFSGNKAVGSGGPCTTNGLGVGGAVFSSADATLNNSAFTSNSASGNGTGAGGAIAGATNVIVNKGTFTSNTATATGTAGATGNTGAGGAIYGAQILKITSSTFTANSAALGGNSPSEVVGGAIIGGSAIVSTSNTFTSNAVKQTTGTTGTAAGGALGVLSGTWISDGDTFTSNSATGPNTAGAGAGIVGTGGCEISNTTITSNTATGGLSPGGGVGGGIAVGSACQITHVVISGNVATSTLAAGIGGGGGVLDTGGSTILNSTITGNKAKTEGGGIANVSNPETITNTAVSGNSVTDANTASVGGGGIFSNGGAILDQSTIANNAVNVGGPGPAGGGGIFDTAGVIVLFSTISGNSVTGSALSSGGGGISTSTSILSVDSTIGNNSSSEDGGGIELTGSAMGSFENSTVYKNAATHNGGNANVGSSATLLLVNSILAGGTAAAGKDAQNAGTFTSNGNNIVGSAVTGYTPAAGDLTNTDPKLLPLGNNGGPTFTFADQAAGVSPGTQHITFSSNMCGTQTILVDQRNFTRGAGGKCDVGAYEHAGVATAVRVRSGAAGLARLPKPHFRHAGRTALAFPHLKPVRIKVLPL